MDKLLSQCEAIMPVGQLGPLALWCNEIFSLPYHNRQQGYGQISASSNIGTKALRRIAENGEKKFAVALGNKVLIIRHRFEAYLDWCCDNNIPVGELADEKKDIE